MSVGLHDKPGETTVPNSISSHCSNEWRLPPADTSIPASSIRVQPQAYQETLVRSLFGCLTKSLFHIRLQVEFFHVSGRLNAPRKLRSYTLLHLELHAHRLHQPHSSLRDRSPCASSPSKLKCRSGDRFHRPRTRSRYTERVGVREDMFLYRVEGERQGSTPPRKGYFLAPNDTDVSWHG